MKKRLLACVLAFCLCLTFLPQTVFAAEVIASGTCGKNLDWELTDDGILTIYGTGAMEDYDSPEKAPWYADRAAVTGVAIDEGVTGIGKGAFGMCTGVEEILFAGDAPQIADNAFQGITATAYYHFYNETWTEDKLQNYGGTLTWVAYVYVIDEGTCGEDLTWSLNEDGTLDISGTGAMTEYSSSEKAPWDEYREDISSVVVEDGVTGIGGYAFYRCSNLTGITLSEDLTAIGQYAFSQCGKLTDVTIPDDVTDIGAYAFQDCDALTEITIPAGVTKIGSAPFGGCDSLAKIQVSAENTKFTSDASGVLFDKAKTVLIQAPGKIEGDYIIPDTVTGIGPAAFVSCANLSGVTIPDSVTDIDARAFGDCKGLTEILFEGLAPDIAADAFSNVTATAAYHASNGTWTEDKLLSYGGTLTWEPYVLTVAEGTCGESLSWELTDDGILTISGTGAMEDYTSNGMPWYNYRAQITGVIVEEGVTGIGARAFYQCTKLTGVSIPESLTGIGTSTFYGCSALTQINLPEAVTKIGAYAFYDCSSLTNVTIPEKVTEIGDYLFYSCDSLAKITIPEAVTEIRESAFQDCLNLTDITFCGKAPAIDDTAFTGVTAAAFYPLGYEWTEDDLQGYGGTLTWEAYCREHVWSEWAVTTEPACTEKGTEKRTCTLCGEAETREVEALGHDYKSVATAPTCTEKGYTTHTCTRCGDSYVDTYVDAKGHSYDDWVTTKEPTCTEKGSATRTCAPCGATETKELDALGHDFEDGECTRCGAQGLEIPKLLSIYSREQTSCKATWTPVDHAEGYELWRTTAPEDEESWRRIKTIKDGAQDRYTNQGLEVGITYYYKVRAYIGEEEATRVYSEFSEVKYMPAAVVFDDPYSNSTFRIRLRWEEIGGADGYQIWRLNDDGTWGIIKTLGDKGNSLTNDQGATTAYSNTGLEAGKQYTYRMRAFAIPEDGVKVFGAYSDEFTVAVMPEAPEVSATSPKPGRAELSWEAVNGAAGYQIWMAESGNGEYKIIKSVTDGSTAYTKYDLTSGKTYYFKVRAYVEVKDKKTFGAYSDIQSVTVK